MPAAVFVIAAFWPGADHIPEAIGFRISTARLLPQALCFKLRVRQRSCFFSRKRPESDGDVHGLPV